MKRLYQRYEDVIKMPVEDRDEIFQLEMRIIEEERKQAEEQEARARRGK